MLPSTVIDDGWLLVSRFCNFIFGHEFRRPRAGAVEAMQAGDGIRCCVDRKGHVVGRYEITEVFTADFDIWFSFLCLRIQ